MFSIWDNSSVAKNSIVALALAWSLLFFSRLIGNFGAVDGVQVGLHSAVLVLAVHPFQQIVAPLLMRRTAMRLMPLAAIVGCVVASFPASFLSPSISWILGVMPLESGAILTREAFLADFAERWPKICLLFATLGTLLWMLLCYPFWLARIKSSVERERGESTSSHSDVGDAVPNSPLSAILETKGREVVALAAEQHYVRVHFKEGSDLVLMRFRDAVGAMAPFDGLKVHRSYWVLKDAVKSAVHTKSGLFLRLVNGIEVPVSRSFCGVVKEVFD